MGYRAGMLPVTEDRADRLVRLPLYAGLSDDQASRIVIEVRRFFGLPCIADVLMSISPFRSSTRKYYGSWLGNDYYGILRTAIERLLGRATTSPRRPRMKHEQTAT